MSQRRKLPLLDVDPDLGALLPDDRLDAARRDLDAEVYRLAQGPWSVGGDDANPEHVGLLLVDGVIARELVVSDTVSTELLGPGDVVRPWSLQESPALLQLTVRWIALTESRVAVLDRRFGAHLARWPEVNAALIDRVNGRAKRLAVTQAISQLNRVDRRLLALFWHLAERWGRMTKDGVAVPLTLSHRMLGQLVGARRPPVTSSCAAATGRGCSRASPSARPARARNGSSRSGASSSAAFRWTPTSRCRPSCPRSSNRTIRNPRSSPHGTGCARRSSTCASRPSVASSTTRRSSAPPGLRRPSRRQCGNVRHRADAQLAMAKRAQSSTPPTGRSRTSNASAFCRTSPSPSPSPGAGSPEKPANSRTTRRASPTLSGVAGSSSDTHGTDTSASRLMRPPSAGRCGRRSRPAVRPACGRRRSARPPATARRTPRRGRD